MKTKIIWTIFGLMLFSGLNISAQEFKFGLLAGFDVANARLTNKPEIEGDSRIFYPMISFNANGYVGFRSAGLWGISLEPGFIQKGGVQKGIDDNIRFQLNYIQMPILFDLFIGDKIFVSVGPELSYMINAKAKSKEVTNDISDLYDKDFEVSGMIGINYNIFDKLDIGLRYNHGLTYISKIRWTNATGEEQGESKEYNQYFQLIVRFKV